MGLSVPASGWRCRGGASVVWWWWWWSTLAGANTMVEVELRVHISYRVAAIPGNFSFCVSIRSKYSS